MEPSSSLTSGDGWLALERQLASRARAKCAVRAALARLSMWMRLRRGWEPLGYARTADYARERLGLSARSFQDLAHVGSALCQLPQLETALVEGEILWSKARLLARVATHEDELRWIAHARSVSVRTVEHEVRQVYGGSVEAGGAETDEDGTELWPQQTVQIRCSIPANGKWHYARQLARRVAGEPLPVWQCVEMLAAEVSSAFPLEPSGEPDSEPDSVSHPGSLHGLEPAPALDEPLHLDTGAARMQFEVLIKGAGDANPFELDARLREAVRLEQRLDAGLGELLAVIATRRVFRALGFASLHAYARERLGISPRKASALLRLERASACFPELKHAYREGGLSWVQAQTLLPLFLEECAPQLARAWIAWAQQVTVRRLQDDADQALHVRETDPRTWVATAGLPAQAQESAARVQRADSQTCADHSAPQGKVESARVFFVAPHDVAQLFRAVLRTVRRRIERETGRLPSEGEALEAMLDHAIACWGGYDESRRGALRVFERDGWRCTIPGCSSLRNLHDHHIVFRSAGGGDELENRTTLCVWHHLRGVHAGIIRVKGRAPHQLSFELGLRPNGRALSAYSSGDRRR